MNMTQQQLEEGFAHQVKMFSSLGRERQAEIWAQVWNGIDRRRIQEAQVEIEQIEKSSARKTSRRKQPPTIRAGAVRIY